MLYFVVVLLNVILAYFVYDTYSKLSDVRSSLQDGLERLKKLEVFKHDRFKSPQEKQPEAKFKSPDKQKPKKYKHPQQQPKSK